MIFINLYRAAKGQMRSIQASLSCTASTASVLTAIFCLVAGATFADSPVGHEFLQEHCVHCHDSGTSEGGLNLEELKLTAADPENLAKWAKVYDRVVAGEMPPEDEERPDPQELQAFSKITSSALNELWKSRYTAQGRVGGRRLNPVEYETTLRDLLAVPWLELRDMLPPDPESHGFDNVAAAQEISYVQLARYLEAAEVAIDGAMRLRPAPKPTTVRTWFTEEGRYLGKDWKERYKPMDLYHEPTALAADSESLDPKAPAASAVGSDDRLDWPEWTGFWQQPNNAQAPRHIRNTSQQIPGWYRFRVRCRAALWDKGELFPPEQGQVAWITTAAKRVLAKFDVPEGDDGGVVEFIAWQQEKELLDFFCATLDDRMVSFRTKTKDAKTMRDAYEGFMKEYRGHGIAVDWFEIEGPFADDSCEGGANEQQWPSASYRELFGDLPIEPWTKTSGLRPPEPLNRPDLTANKHGLRETFQLPPDMVMVVSKEPRKDAETLLRRLIKRANRGQPEESEIQRCLVFALEAIDDQACFQDAMRLAYKAVLCSPDFLYLQERPGELDGHGLAARLSYTLWRSMPDSELIEVAASGELLTDVGLQKQFDRMLGDPRSKRFVSDFTGQWLDLRKIHDTSPDRDLFPEYFSDSLVVDSSVAETEATFAELIRENLPAKTIVDADFVMVNERLAELYNIDGVKGQDIRRVALPADSPYGGLLTQSSVMKVTANGLTTSPVLRGVWVMDRILGTPPSPPPPGAGSIEPDTRGATTVRELLAKHSRSETCASCHQSIDPPGFALESFDVMGKWRDHYRSMGEGKKLDLVVALREVKYRQGLPVDASGVTEDGNAFNDIHEFRKVLVAQDEQLARNLTERFLTFATGASVSYADRDVVESILHETKQDGYPIRTLLQQVILSKTFRSK